MMSEFRIEVFDHPPAALSAALGRWQTPNGMEAIAIPWTTLAAAANPDRVTLHWFTVHTDDRLLAVGIVYVINDLAIGDYAGGFLEHMTDLGRRFGYVPLTVDVAFLEIPFSNRPGIFFAPDIGADERMRITRSAVDKLDQWLAVDAICVKSDTAAPLFPSDERSLFALEFDKEYVLKLPGAPPTMADWLAARRRKFRYNVKRQRRIFKASGAALETLRADHGESDRLAALLARTTARARARGEMPMPMDVAKPFFDSFHAVMGDRGAIRAARMDGVIIGFSILLFGHDTVFFKFIGLDYEISTEVFAYFEFDHDALEIAIERGMPYLDMGTGMPGVKLRLGCDEIEKTYHVRFRRFLRPVGVVLSKMFRSRFDRAQK